MQKGTKGGKIGTIARQAMQGATFGFSDEATDAIAGVLAGVVSPDLTIEQAIKEARKISKEDLARDWQNAPVTSFAAQVAGGLPIGLTKAAVNAGNWIRGGTALQGIGKGAAVGAGYGGLAGLGAGEDTLSGRVGGAVSGAAIGGAIGGATAPLFRLGTPPKSIDYNKVVKKTTKGAQSKAEKKLFEELAARPDLRDQLARAEAMDAASKRTGIDLTLAEKIAQSQSDPLLAQQGVIGQNPMTAGRMEQMYAMRSGTPTQSGQIENVLMKQAQDLSGGHGSYDEVAQALIEKSGKAAGDITKKLVAEANPLYEDAFRQVVPENEIGNLITKQPIIENAIKNAFNDERFSAQLRGKPLNSVEVLDAAKRIIDEKIRAGASPMQPFDTRAYKAAQEQLLGLADKYAPSYAQARQVYSGNPDALQMRQRIGAVADIDPLQAQQVASKLFSGTQQNAKLAAQALGQDAPKAAAARIFNAMDTLRNPLDPASGNTTMLANKIAPDSRALEMLRSYGAPQSLEDTLNVVNQAKLAERYRTNSVTNPMQQAQAGMDEAANAGIDLLTGNKVGLLRKVAGMFGKPENDPQFYKDMADLMLTDRGMDLLRRASMGQQTAIQELQTVSPSLRISTGAMTSAPTTRAIVGGAASPQTVQPTQQDDFSDIEAILNQPQDDFSDIEAILNQPQTGYTESNKTENLPTQSSPFLDRVATAESSGNPNARAKTSSASGLFQFTDPTWGGMVKNYGAQTGITLADKNDPEKQRIMAGLLTKENTNAYKSAGITPDETDLYMAHFLGAPSAVKARKNMDAYGAELFPAAAQANKNIFYKNGKPRTVEEIRSLLGSKIGA